MKDNKYLEEFKIDLVKQYLQGKQQKDICKEYGVAKSTMWGWICKYASLIEKSWEVKGVETCEDEYVDITMPLKNEYKDRNIINTTNESVRVFLRCAENAHMGTLGVQRYLYKLFNLDMLMI